MSIVVEIPYTKKLEKAKLVLGSDSDLDTIEMGLDRILESENTNAHHDEAKTEGRTSALDDAYWEDLFSDPPLPDGAALQALLDDRNEARY